ncbi:hypothetical protein C1H87_06745 [Flavivirga eckloniae]|uniref:Uncharacterized protein n=1 Tax=Flavivirga eckloniae TaxID=1803846 RepID=A0A2K9PMY6_9FLAO|nr:hypothetical protein C1H87_06745 [Flavivirga eckloniae]
MFSLRKTVKNKYLKKLTPFLLGITNKIITINVFIFVFSYPYTFLVFIKNIKIFMFFNAFSYVNSTLL